MMSAASKDPEFGSKDEEPSLTEKTTTHITNLKDMDKFDTPECLKILKALSKFYWDFVPERADIADVFVKEGFSEHLIKMLKTLNATGLFTNDDVWFNAYYTFNLAWNYTDCSAGLAKDLMKYKIVEFLDSNLGHQPYLDNLKSKNVYYVIKASLSILQNLSRAVDTPEEVDLFEQVKEKIKTSFLSSDDDFLRTLATMILTAIISEEENKMMDDTGAIKFMVNTLGKALSNTRNRRHRGFSPVELVECICRMAVNDNNKTKIVSEGALPHLVTMMQYTDVQEQAIAARTVWNLCFDSSLREQIRGELGMLDSLEALKHSPDKNARDSSKGALWTMNESQREVAEDSEPAKDHVFLSYNWSNQAMVKRINEALKANGFRTWIDVEQMGGSTLEAMANAIETAAVVVICASEKYKLSPNCRTEADYTFQIKKPIVPLMMQRRYKPDGWLGMLLGSRFYVDFNEKYEFDVAFSMFVKELNGRGRDNALDDSVDVVDAQPIRMDNQVSVPDGPAVPDIIPAQAVPVTAAIPSEPAPRRHPVQEWSNERVREFFDKESLQNVKHHFDAYDGKMLYSFKLMRREAPDFFYHHLQDKLCMDLSDILKLMSELDSIT